MQQTILILEDEQGIRELFRDVLEEAGYRVIVGKDGEEGLRLVRDERPDLVVSNVRMPKLDGVRTTRAIRADASLDGMPIILMSGAATSMNHAPSDAFLEKPFQLDTLIETVARLLDGVRATPRTEAE
jgi:DNA-binding response OmpR family regulator